MEGEQKGQDECYKKKHMGEAVKIIFLLLFSFRQQFLCDVLFRKLEEAKALYISIYVNP